mmetsp:Transcript_22386/g.32066  ORF Transcript_22386/g.32066 Transcript_22386/m.32066 type:complete len:187 (+) Transcript_22386:119-679(+)
MAISSALIPLRKHAVQPAVMSRLKTTFGGRLDSRELHASRIIREETRKISSDPHQESAERILENNSSERMQAAEAFKDVTRTVRLQNAALATILVGFVTGVYWYSIQAVGGDIKSGDGKESGAMQYLEEAASEAKMMRDDKLRQEKHLEGLLRDDDEDDELDLVKETVVDKPTKPKRNWLFFWRRE